MFLIICGEAYKQIHDTLLVSVMLPDEDSINSILRPYIQPWYSSIENPQKAQEQVLADLVQKYASTEYGTKHNATQVKSIADYRANFPIIDYSGLIPHLVQVKERRNGSLTVFAENLSSGIYSYSLIADGKLIDTKKMVCSK